MFWFGILTQKCAKVTAPNEQSRMTYNVKYDILYSLSNNSHSLSHNAFTPWNSLFASECLKYLWHCLMLLLTGYKLQQHSHVFSKALFCFYQLENLKQKKDHAHCTVIICTFVSSGFHLRCVENSQVNAKCADEREEKKLSKLFQINLFV